MYFASILLYVLVILAFVPSLAGQNSPDALPDVVGHSQPTYPPLARQARIQGDVRARFNTDGELVKEAEAVSGHELLRKAAEENVRTWRFVPHTPATFYVTFRYKLASGDVDVGFLEAPAIVEIEASPAVATIDDYAWIDLGTWKAKLTSANRNSLLTFKLRYSGPHAEWVDGSAIDANGKGAEIDFGHKEDEFLAFTVKLGPDENGRVTFFVGRMKGNRIIGTFVDDVGMTGKWTATRAIKSRQGS